MTTRVLNSELIVYTTRIFCTLRLSSLNISGGPRRPVHPSHYQWYQDYDNFLFTGEIGNAQPGGTWDRDGVTVDCDSDGPPPWNQIQKGLKQDNRDCDETSDRQRNGMRNVQLQWWLTPFVLRLVMMIIQVHCQSFKSLSYCLEGNNLYEIWNFEWML